LSIEGKMKIRDDMFLIENRNGIPRARESSEKDWGGKKWSQINWIGIFNEFEDDAEQFGFKGLTLLKICLPAIFHPFLPTFQSNR